MFKNLFSRAKQEVTSIESILGHWLSAVGQLEAHAQAKLSEAAQHAEAADRFTEIATQAKVAEKAALDVAVKANTIAQQLGAVVTSHANGTPAA